MAFKIHHHHHCISVLPVYISVHHLCMQRSEEVFGLLGTKVAYGCELGINLGPQQEQPVLFNYRTLSPFS